MAIPFDLDEDLHAATLRGTAMAELDAMEPRFSQWLPGEDIPEQHWMYRWSKKYWFNDFAAYRQADLDGVERAKALALAGRNKPAPAVL